jgi:hypothetical protein
MPVLNVRPPFVRATSPTGRKIVEIVYERRTSKEEANGYSYIEYEYVFAVVEADGTYSDQPHGSIERAIDAMRVADKNQADRMPALNAQWQAEGDFVASDWNGRFQGPGVTTDPRHGHRR